MAVQLVNTIDLVSHEIILRSLMYFLEMYFRDFAHYPNYHYL
jgi:hypothetical protein